jgi:hypothetical protein
MNNIEYSITSVRRGITMPVRRASVIATVAAVLSAATVSNEAAIVQFRRARYTAGESSSVMVEVLHTHRKDVSVVHYETSPIDAVPGRDYAPVSGTLSIYPGERIKWLEIPVFYDWETEAPVRFNVTLSEPGPGTRIGRRKVTTITLVNSPWDAATALSSKENLIILDGGRVVRLRQSSPSSGSFITDWRVSAGYPLQPHKITCDFSVSEMRAGPRVCYGFSCFSTSYPAAIGTDRVTFEFTSPFGGTYTNTDTSHFMFGAGGTFELPGPRPE